MKRRDLLKTALVLPLAGVMSGEAATARSRVRPGDAAWRSTAEWERLRKRVGGRLVQPVSPFAPSASQDARATALEFIGNPYYIGDEVSLTQTSGWMQAWRSAPSVYAVAAETTADVGTGLSNVSRRLELLFGGDHELLLAAREPRGTVVTVTFPVSS
jgi:hypothetical protein